MLHRRRFLEVGAAVAAGAAALPATARAAAEPGWSSGGVAHILPTASDRRILVKVSLLERPALQPALHLGGRSVPGQMTDTEGLFWQFDADGLEPGTRHELHLVSGDRPLCDPWPLATMPAPDTMPSRFRLLAYTCAGGHDILPESEEGGQFFLPVATRARMLRRAMSFAPDAVVANGDQVYWDMRSGRPYRRGGTPLAVGFAGMFQRDQPVLGTVNEAVLKRAAGPQIAPMYGTLFRSTPVFFTMDDHDYFENDDADDEFVSLPPDWFMLNLARTTQRLYYPEFLPVDGRPLGLPSSSAADRPPGLAESFGTLRWGRLAELNLVDTRRHMTRSGPTGVLVPSEVEAWLKARMAESDAAHIVTVPSLPPGWTKGNDTEWYPEVLDRDAKRFVPKDDKPYWHAGWQAQHDRLLAAASARRDRTPLFIGGDIHSVGEGRVRRTGAHDLRANPVVSILPGPLSTKGGWPSSTRAGLKAAIPASLEVEETFPILEEDGFILCDFEPDRLTVRYFRWHHHRPVEAIDELEPFHTSEFPLPA